MDCKELYAQKLMTAAQAAALVKSGDWVDYGFGAGFLASRINHMHANREETR